MSKPFSSFDSMIKALGENGGYGALMQSAGKLWRQSLIDKGYPGGGELSVGPCVAMLVPCPHLEKDADGHCEWCCGSGRVTKRVIEAQIASANRQSR